MEIKNTYTMLVTKPYRREYFGDLSINGGYIKMSLREVE
jgi:hypothetical protein